MTPYDNATLLPIINVAKDNIAQAIVQVSPDYFGEVSTTATISGQQEYTKPDGLILMKRIDVSYTDTNRGSYFPTTMTTLAQMSDYGEDWYTQNQDPTHPMVRFDDTGFFLYPEPQSTSFGSAFLRLWWVPKRADLTDLTDATNDIESLTGIGGIFHQLIGDTIVDWIKGKQGTESTFDVQLLTSHVQDILNPSAFRIPSTQTSSFPNDTYLQY